MTTTRLIERWLPIAEIGIESVRERTPMTPYPAPNRLHVWWARRPLVASRAAVLASILPADADKAAFKHALGIHGDPVRGVALIDRARRTGIRVNDPYGYERAFKYSPDTKELEGLLGPNRSKTVILDATAGGGAIPFETVRLGMTAIANDLNPVASFIQHTTIQYPQRYGQAVLDEYRSLSIEFRKRLGDVLEGYIPQAQAPSEEVTAILWARSITCPYCDGKVPLSPNWRLAPSGTGVRLNPKIGAGLGDSTRHCTFSIVESSEDQSSATIADGDALCPFPDCGRAISGDDVKRQARDGNMGDQMFAIVYRRQEITKTKTGKNKVKWVRGFRAPLPSDENDDQIAALLAEKMPEWEALDILPTEVISEVSNYDRGHRMYGMLKWKDLFSSRQLYAHGCAVETYRKMLDEEQNNGRLSGVRDAAYCYLAVSIDTVLNYGNRSCRWDIISQTIRSIFDRHGFALCWSYGEMSLMIDGLGYDWAIKKTDKALAEILSMIGLGKRGDMLDIVETDNGEITIINGSGASMPSLEDASIDAIVMDPPYGANVMYAELSDFFYVWLKRTAGLVVPSIFTRQLADKNAEAVANRALFKGQPKAAILADDDYRSKMEGIFAECRRVLKNDGIMTVMFTHKDTGAWDALAMSLMDAGFVITASWPVNTEASGSLHIKDKAAANSTIFLVCRPRADAQGETMYWEDVEPEVARAVRARVGEFQQGGIQGVDLYLASFGPALEAFSKHWPLTRGTPAPEPKKKRRSQGDMFEEFDPYAVRPEDALNAARREVKAWRLAQLASAKAQADMDGPTAFYVLAWDAFKAVSFPYDEALRLARAVGVDLDTQVIGRLAEKKAAEIKLWDSATRIAKGAIGQPDGSRGMIDALHHAAHVMRTRGAEAAQEMLEQAGVAQDDEFKVAMEALLEVLPPSKTFSGIDADKAVKPAADDFDALEKLRRIAYEGEIGEPAQLELYRELMAAE